jgi:hypothetical protein
VAVVLDEFPHLAGAQPGIPSLLQRLWDEYLSQTNLFLVLCGSHIGMMEREVLAYRAPLYGRRTGQLLLHPLSFRREPGFQGAGVLRQVIDGAAGVRLV